MKVLPLTVFAVEGPRVRLYLRFMKEQGYLAERIVRLIPTRTFGHSFKANYWPLYIRIFYPQLLESMKEAMSPLFPDIHSKFRMVLKPILYGNYAKSVSEIRSSEGLESDELAQWLTKNKPNVVLLTGGGRVPVSLLNRQTRFLHVHPAELPYVRGADGILWSALLGNRLFGSTLFLDQKRDLGEMLSVQRFSFPSSRIKGKRPIPQEILYRAINSYLDPLIRAECLRRLLNHPEPLFQQGAGQKQMEEEGITYHFMTGALRKRALEKFFLFTSMNDLPLENERQKMHLPRLSEICFEQYPAPVDSIRTADKVDELINHFRAGKFSLEDRAVLDRLCRKIEVVKRVDYFYETDWSWCEGSVEVSGKFYAALLNVLLHFSERDRFQGEFAYGIKYLNAAFRIIEISRGQEGFFIDPTLIKTTERLLECLPKNPISNVITLQNRLSSGFEAKVGV